MSYPTVLGPWFVVQRLNHNGLDQPVYVEYYTALDEGVSEFQQDKKRALLFSSLHSAARVASAEGAEVRVLSSKEEAEEFGRN